MQTFSYSIDEIKKIVDAEVLQKAHDNPVLDIVYDSRRQNLGKNSLFIALKGIKRDGNNFINHAYKQGIRNFLVSQNPDLKEYSEANILQVKNPLKSLQNLSAYHRAQFKELPVLAITGSNGKTIVKEWLYELLNKEINLLRSPNSYNSQIGVPLSLSLIESDCKLAIIEAGISQKGEMQTLEEIIRPTIGLLTHFGDAHQINFKDRTEKLLEKLKLFQHTNFLIHWYDEEIIKQVKAQYPELKTVTCGYKPKADIYLHKIKPQVGEGSYLYFRYLQKEYSVYIPFSNSAAIENALYAISFMLSFAQGQYFDAKKFASLPGISMRLELTKAQFNSLLINDAYNIDLNSLNIALDFLNQQAGNRQKVLILSDIVQSIPENELFGQLEQRIQKSGIKLFIGIGEKLLKNQKRFKTNFKSYFYRDTEKFLQQFDFKKISYSAILLKGARNFKFEKIANRLTSLHHTTRMEINLSALEHNLNVYRKKLKAKTKIMVMVKAFSYGSGTAEISRWLEHQQVDYLGVAYADEGMKLREAGIRLPIMVMNTAPEDFETIIKYKLEPEVYSILIFTELKTYFKSLNIEHYPVHIKLDTGMHRLGFEASSLSKLCTALEENNEFKVISIFSHLAAADQESENFFTQKQIHIFQAMSTEIEKVLNYPILRHILNSAGIENFTDAQFEMVRLGIGLYGISPTNKFKLKNVSSLKTIVSQIKKIKAGETIGYNRKGKMQKDGKIATLPIGYADGLRRELGLGKLSVYIKGQFAPVIGRICMDMTLIDVSKIEVKEGDEVEIFGQHQSISQIAQKLNTIAYEVLTGISSRVKRLYYYE